MRFSDKPLWLVGFRPFFALACLSGLTLPVLWALLFSGTLAAPAAPTAPFSPTQWHAHEMFFGFGWAVLLVAVLLGLALLAFDGSISRTLRDLKPGGDLRRELEALQQYGQFSASVLAALIILLVDRARTAHPRGRGDRRSRRGAGARRG